MADLLEKIKNKTATICVVGAGYVGLPNVVLFAENGFNVIAADTSERIVSELSKGRSHIFDPELNESVPKAFATGRITATRDVKEAARKSDAILVSVPTPAENSEPDLRYVEASARAIGKGIRKGSLVVLESTVYPGVCEGVLAKIISKESGGLVAGKDFFVAHCPERMNPGDRGHNIFNTKRIVGGLNAESLELAKKLYESVGLGMFPVSSLRTAELVKLVENTQRDVNIAFMSEIALLSEKIGVNVKELVEACSTKWNFYKVLPGAGVGGHCLPNNPYYILKIAESVGVEMPLMMTARRTNDQMMQHVVDLVERVMHGKVAGKKIALLGVAYKANVDDVRQAPSRFIAAVLKLSGAEVVYHDPLVNETNGNKIDAKKVSLEEALSADCLVVLCKHDAFKGIKPEQVKAKAVVDCCFLFEKKDFENYVGVGNA